MGRLRAALLVGVATAWMATTSSGMVSAQTQKQGRTVWDGVYTADQASRGKEQYATHCSMCHVADLRGDGMAPALVGDDFMRQWSDLSANDLFVRMRSSMPQDNPRSLADDVYVDLLAYIFEANKFPAGQQELKHDPDVLKGITISTGKN